MSTAIAFLVVISTFGPSSSAQTKWFKYEGNPVLDVGPPGSWDEVGMFPKRIIIQDSIYRMWYCGVNATSGAMGYAISPDGVRWTKHNSNPILSGTRGSWDSIQAYLGYVIFNDSKYGMWYTGGDGKISRIGYAGSRDGIVWTKFPKPVLKNGPMGWDMGSVGNPSLLNISPSGSFKMWFYGFDGDFNRANIGYASGSSESSWTKHPEPVLQSGNSGSWDDRRVHAPKILYNRQMFEMWYAGERTDYRSARTGYAVSQDGIHWTKSSENPVLEPGPAGSWDDEASWVGEVIFDGKTYWMWYQGHDGSKIRAGLALSPEGTTINISPSYAYVAPRSGTVRVTAKVNDPSNLSFYARINALPKGEFQASIISRGGLQQVDLLRLFDDGAHGDGLAADGLFANSWTPREEQFFFVDLLMKLRQKNNLSFEMNNASKFTTIGPITCDSFSFLGDATPTPGDSVFVKLVLRNHGTTATAKTISASLGSIDSSLADIASVSTTFGDIAPGEIATTTEYYRLLISPDCPVNKDITLNVSISSLGIPLWSDTLSFRILAPWWRSDWAYVLYFGSMVVLFYGARRFEMRRIRLRHLIEMEHFQAQKLKDLDRLKSRFFANISHEFRTPLTLIEGPVEQMLSGEFKGDANAQYEMILRNSKRLKGLINQLLDLSKLEAGEMKLRASATDLIRFAKTLVHSFSSLAERKKIILKFASLEEVISVYLDREKGEKILSNLVSNALKFTEEGGQVEVAVSKGNKHVEIRVVDTGVGIPKSRMNKVFDRFYQVDDTYTREQEGTGIGLALTKELVELHKGEVTVESEEGKGSTFTVRLPLGKDHLKPEELIDKDEELQIDTSKDYVSSTPGESQRRDVSSSDESTIPVVLIVEDNVDFRMYMRSYLDQEYRVLEAHDGNDGLQKANDQIPDLIISDLMMPNMDGVQLCERLKTDERTSHIPIILLTARAARESKLEALETGADDYITKPFDARELLMRAKNLIDQRRKLKERFQEGSFKLKEIAVNSVDERFLSRVFKALDARLSDADFDPSILAEEVAMSRMQLHRKLKALTGFSAGELIRDVRLKRAADMLQKRAATVSEIAYGVGFNSLSYFAKLFREKYGVNPSDFAASKLPSDR